MAQEDTPRELRNIEARFGIEFSLLQKLYGKVESYYRQRSRRGARGAPPRDYYTSSAFAVPQPFRKPWDEDESDFAVSGA
jgi:hypothetical protein